MGGESPNKETVTDGIRAGGYKILLIDLTKWVSWTTSTAICCGVDGGPVDPDLKIDYERNAKRQPKFF